MLYTPSWDFGFHLMQYEDIGHKTPRRNCLNAPRELRWKLIPFVSENLLGDDLSIQWTV